MEQEAYKSPLVEPGVTQFILLAPYTTLPCITFVISVLITIAITIVITIVITIAIVLVFKYQKAPKKSGTCFSREL